MNVRSFVAVLPASSGPAVTPALLRTSASGWLSVAYRDVTIWFRPRSRCVAAGARTDHTPLMWRLGDDAECRAVREPAPCANAATISYDPATATLTVDTSIVGLPPVFVHEGVHETILASDLYLIAGVADRDLELDPASVAELARIGYPVDCRTLFRNTRRLPSGSRITFQPQYGMRVERTWRLPAPVPATWQQFVDRQIDAFTNALLCIDLSRSFLSLTAGLDTRTVFAVLADQQRLVPAATMTGPRPSIDASRAAALCRAYGVPHMSVAMDDEFIRQLPDYAQLASRLSGGLATIQQAPEIHFYSRLGRRFAGRLSGNLGNHVGRAGTEGIATRSASTEILSVEFRDREPRSRRHWMLARINEPNCQPVEFILQDEFPAALVGNFGVGSHFALQQTPYAARTLIDTLSWRPNGNSPLSGSPIRMRVRDLQHRFFGEPTATSFQRSLLVRLGGPAASYPINYGWRANRPMALSSWSVGVAALAGMAVQKHRLDAGRLGPLIERAGIIDLQDFSRPAFWLRRHLREFACDTLQSSAVRQSGILDRRAVGAVLAELFTGRRDRYDTVAFALEVALAHRFFCTSAARSFPFEVD